VSPIPQLQVLLTTQNKKLLSKPANSIYLTTKTGRCHGGGRNKKWPEIERYVVNQYISASNDYCATALFVKGKQNTLRKFIARTLDRNNWSVQKITISQSVPVDWRSKAAENTARIRQKFKDELL